MENIKNNVKTAVSNLANLKEETAVIALSVITFIIVFIAFLYYFYYSGTLFTNGLMVRECKNMRAIYGTLNGKIRSIGGSEFDHPFKDYYIKSAYNCCSGGNYKNDYVDTCILKTLLQQGVRGLDFEIFSINDQPVVATTTSDNYCVKETFNYIGFSEIMNILKNYAFATATAPNPLDPIIVHLRIKSTNKEMYDNFAKILEQYDSILLGKEFSYENQGKNFGNTPLNKLAGKVVIIVDRSNNSFLESELFREYINMTSNSIFMRALHYHDIKYTPDINELIEYNKQNMTIGMPDVGSSPENPSSTVMREMGIQMLAMRYQLIDVNIEDNDVFFDNNGYAFALKPERLRYIPVTIPAPPKQDPALSYATRNISSDFYNFDI